jgi:hypothetical protein
MVYLISPGTIFANILLLHSVAITMNIDAFLSSKKMKTSSAEDRKGWRWACHNRNVIGWTTPWAIPPFNTRRADVQGG